MEFLITISIILLVSIIVVVSMYKLIFKNVTTLERDNKMLQTKVSHSEPFINVLQQHGVKTPKELNDIISENLKLKRDLKSTQESFSEDKSQLIHKVITLKGEIEDLKKKIQIKKPKTL